MAPYIEGLSGKRETVLKKPLWRCSNKLLNGKGVCSKSITLKESLLLKLLSNTVYEKLNSKKNIRESLAKTLSDYVNPKDINEKKKQLNNELKEIDQKISEILDKGMLLVSRGVQDESLLEEHLEQCYITKRILNNEFIDLEDKLNKIKLNKQNKVLKSLEKNEIKKEVMTQEELSVFIKHIVVKKDSLVVTMMDEEIELLLK